MKLKDAYKNAQDYLKKRGIDSYLSDARFLITAYLNCDMSHILLNPDKEILYDDFEKMLKKRAEGMPCAYITGKTEFMGLAFFVNENVLIPRQDTEVLIESVLDEIKNENKKILDVCTGSGCIAVSLKHFCEDACVSALDISPDALKTAQKNATYNKTDITFLKCNILNDKPEGKYDVIVSNPPYIETEVIKTLSNDVKGFEPHLALDGGEDGLLFYRRISSIARDMLNEDGMLFYEIGYNQGNAIRKILTENGFRNIEIVKDYSGNDRVVKCNL